MKKARLILVSREITEDTLHTLQLPPKDDWRTYVVWHYNDDTPAEKGVRLEMALMSLKEYIRRESEEA